MTGAPFINIHANVTQVSSTVQLASAAAEFVPCLGWEIACCLLDPRIVFGQSKYEIVQRTSESNPPVQGVQVHSEDETKSQNENSGLVS